MDGLAVRMPLGDTVALVRMNSLDEATWCPHLGWKRRIVLWQEATSSGGIAITVVARSY